MFKKVQALLGGRVRIILTASAPVNAQVLDFLRASLGCLVRIKEASSSHLVHYIINVGDRGLWPD